MKTTMYCLIGIVLALGLLALAISLLPKGQAKVGLVAGKLSPCPDTPNCVCSEDSSAAAYIAPFLYDDSAWQIAKKVIIASGGQIQTDQQGYLWASFTSKWLGFVDDVELRMDADNNIIHVRSASRVGHSDFGMNRNRVERLRLMFADQNENTVTK